MGECNLQTAGTHFPHHSQFHKWANPITKLLSPPLPISHLGKSDYPSCLPTTSNFAPGHLQSPTFSIISNLIVGHLPLPTQFYHHSPFHTRADLTTHPISHLGTSNYTANVATSPNVTSGHIELPTHFPNCLKFHTWAHLTTCSIAPPPQSSHLGTYN